jgi:hypothetical protein
MGKIQNGFILKLLTTLTALFLIQNSKFKTVFLIFNFQFSIFNYFVRKFAFLTSPMFHPCFSQAFALININNQHIPKKHAIHSFPIDKGIKSPAFDIANFVRKFAFLFFSFSILNSQFSIPKKKRGRGVLVPLDYNDSNFSPVKSALQ